MSTQRDASLHKEFSSASSCENSGDRSRQRRRLLLSGLGLATMANVASIRPAKAQHKAAYTGSTPIELIVPGGPGAGTDVVARIVAQGLSRQINNPIVVKNLPGAAGIIGAQAVARAKPNGYTLLFAITGTHTVNQFLYPDLSYDPKKDFAPVSLVCKYNNVLVVRPDFEAQNFKDLVALIRSNPGKYFYGITQNGSSSHLAMELLKSEAKLELRGVPYRGAAAAVTDFLGGQYPVLMDTVINQLPLIRSGKVIPLATTGNERSPVLPDVPTMMEGGFPKLAAIGWGGLMAPANTPEAMIATLNQGMKATIASSIFNDLKNAGLETQYSTAAEMAAFLERESEKWGRLVKAGSITPS